jgi:hypothetical protein
MFQVSSERALCQPMSREEEREGQATTKQIAGSAKTIAKLDELESKLETILLHGLLFINQLVSRCWMVCGQWCLRHMTYDRKIFNRFQEQEGGM